MFGLNISIVQKVKSLFVIGVGMMNLKDTKMIKEEITVIERDDDRIRIVYWNKAVGSSQIICSKKIAQKIKRQLMKLL